MILPQSYGLYQKKKKGLAPKKFLGTKAGQFGVIDRHTQGMSQLPNKETYARTAFRNELENQ